MKVRTVLCSILTMLLLAAFGFVSAKQKESESEKLIRSAKFLEEKPFDKEAKDIRKEAIVWIIQTDKVTVNACSLLLNGLDKKYKYGSDLFGQYTIGMAAFKLANPDKATEEEPAQLAGVESAIPSYEAMLKAQPKAQNEFMDDLIARRSNNALAEHVKANNCKDRK